MVDDETSGLSRWPILVPRTVHLSQRLHFQIWGLVLKGYMNILAQSSYVMTGVPDDDNIALHLPLIYTQSTSNQLCIQIHSTTYKNQTETRSSLEWTSFP